jgi:hypothetical protein
MNRVSVGLQPHTRQEIRQMKPRPRHLHRNAISRVQAEKPHPRLSFRIHIGPHIQLWKCRQTRQCRRPTQSHARHPKRHNADPRSTVERIELQTARYQLSHFFRGHRPMRKQQIVPVLRHDPWLFGQCPWPVLYKFQRSMHLCFNIPAAHFSESNSLDSKRLKFSRKTENSHATQSFRRLARRPEIR